MNCMSSPRMLRYSAIFFYKGIRYIVDLLYSCYCTPVYYTERVDVISMSIFCCVSLVPICSRLVWTLIRLEIARQKFNQMAFLLSVIPSLSRLIFIQLLILSTLSSYNKVNKQTNKQKTMI